jgi:hypothetical protein
MKLTISALAVCTLVTMCGGWLVVPSTASAARGDLGCNLIAITSLGAVLSTDETDIYVVAGEAVTFIWQGVNADTAFGPDRKAVATLGLMAYSPTTDTSYSYHFYRAGTKVACTANVTVVTGNITNKTLATASTKPTIRGTVTGTDHVYLELYTDTAKAPYYTSKVATVKNGTWSFKITKTLAKREYTAVLRGEKGNALNIITEETLRVGTAVPRSNSAVSPDLDISTTTFVTEVVPLLSGGTIKVGTTVPISYLQVINIGSSEGLITGFTIKQTGNAAVAKLASISVVSERGTHAQVHGTTFKNGIVQVPVSIPIIAGEMLLFTLKTELANDATSEIAKQYKLDVTGVTTNATMQGVFPVRGTTWTVGQ